MSSSEGDDYLDSADVNEEFDFEDEGSESNFEHNHDDGEFCSDEEEGNGEPMEHPKYSLELEYEDIGEPATFNFNIHHGKHAV